MKPRIVVTILIVLFATLAASASISMAQEDPPPLSPDGDIPAGRAQPRPVRVTAPSSAQAAITALTEYLLPIPPYTCYMLKTVICGFRPSPAMRLADWTFLPGRFSPMRDRALAAFGG